MILPFLLSFAFSIDVESVILDPDIQLKRVGENSNASFVVRGIGTKYETSRDNREVRSLDGKVKYVYSESGQRSALYRQTKNVDGSTTTNRYMVEDGLIKSIVNCDTKTLKRWDRIRTYQRHECIYMDSNYCAELDKSKIEALENERYGIGDEGYVSGRGPAPEHLNEILPEGSAKNGTNYRTRYLNYHSRNAITKVREVMGGEVVNVMREGIPSERILATTRRITELCANLKGSTNLPHQPASERPSNSPAAR